MNTFTQEQMTSITEEAKKIFESCAEGKTSIEIMSEIYVNNLNGKTKAQGDVMAEVMLDRVKEFDNDFKAAQENPEGYISSFIAKANENKSLEERCTYWLQFNETISAVIESENNAISPEKLQEIENMKVSAEDANENFAAELENTAKELIANSCIMLTDLPDFCENLERLSNGNKSATMLIDLENKNVDLRAVLSMVVYTRIKNGEFDMFPADITPEQVTTLVCAEVERIRIANNVANGILSVETATTLLAILGTLVITGFILFSIWTFYFTFMGLLALIPMIMVVIPATLIAIVGIFDIVYKCTDVVVSIVTTTVKAVTNGIKSIYDYAVNTVIPKAVEKTKAVCKTIKTKFRNLISKFAPAR